MKEDVHMTNPSGKRQSNTLNSSRNLKEDNNTHPSNAEENTNIWLNKMTKTIRVWELSLIKSQKKQKQKKKNLEQCTFSSKKNIDVSLDTAPSKAICHNWVERKTCCDINRLKKPMFPRLALWRIEKVIFKTVERNKYSLEIYKENKWSNNYWNEK